MSCRASVMARRRKYIFFYYFFMFFFLLFYAVEQRITSVYVFFYDILCYVATKLCPVANKSYVLSVGLL